MCGIAGMFGPPGPSRRVLLKMAAEMAHRGPDDEGVHVDPDGGCGLAHRRLAIIDPAGGHQPMANEDGSVRVVFNGCIYNYQDLTRQLVQHGHTFRTHSDTEAIVHAYEQWGPECVARFNGMWALAVWDAPRRRLLCSRDRLGIKPFYYVWDGKRLVFASEIKALLAAGAAEARVDPEGLGQYLTLQFCLGERTLFDGVRRLPPGRNLLLEAGGEPRTTAYWDLEFRVDEQSGEAVFADRLERFLEDSVRLRLRSDVPLGAHLSGGLDSAVIVSLARTLLGECPVKTFTGAFDEGEAFDETPYARAVSEAAGTDYLETYIGPGAFVDSIETILWHMDEPAAGPGVFPQYWVSRLAGEHVKVVLGGQGGDEIFIGYARYLLAYLEECIYGAIMDTAHRGRYVATLETIVPSLPSLEKYVPMLKSFWQNGLFESPDQRYFALMDRFADSREIVSRDLHGARQRTFEAFKGLFDAQGPASLVNRMLYFDLKTHLPSLLHVEDRTSMAWGLESRVPLLDHRLVELMASVPPVVKFRNGQLKYLFRRAIRHIVPQQILARKDKMGFPVPFAPWVRGPLRDFVGDVLLSRRCRERGIFNPDALDRALASEKTFGRAVWGALCLELWFRRFIDA